MVAIKIDRVFSYERLDEYTSVRATLEVEPLFPSDRQAVRKGFAWREFQHFRSRQNKRNMIRLRREVLGERFIMRNLATATVDGGMEIFSRAVNSRRTLSSSTVGIAKLGKVASHWQSARAKPCSLCSRCLPSHEIVQRLPGFSGHKFDHRRVIDKAEERGLVGN